MHRLNSHPKELQGMQSEPMLTPKEKTRQPDGSHDGRTRKAASHRIANQTLSCPGPHLGKLPTKDSLLSIIGAFCYAYKNEVCECGMLNISRCQFYNFLYVTFSPSSRCNSPCAPHASHNVNQAFGNAINILHLFFLLRNLYADCGNQIFDDE